MQYLSDETKIEFKEKVKRDSEMSKKYDILRFLEYFIKEINYYKKIQKLWNFWILKIDFYYLNLLSYFFALLYNILLLFIIRGDNEISNIDDLKNRRKNKIEIDKLINNSMSDHNLIYIINNYFNLILNTILILLWVIYKLPLYYQIDQIKYKEEYKTNKNKKLSFIDKIYILVKMSIFDRNYISMFIYELIVCILCISIKNTGIIQSFLLLPILYINKTLKSIIISVQLNYKQFLLAMSLSFLIIYVFSNIYFFFQNSDFDDVVDYYNDNYCKTLVYSFLNALDYGLRARGGIGDSAKRISFLKNRKHYITRLILDDIYFLLIVIIMIDLVFGIIINSFDELRHRNQKNNTDMENYCLICNSNRLLLEKMRINFNDHINNYHNCWNYIEYMISLKLKDIQDLNTLNQYVRAKIERNDISFLPTCKDNEIKFDNVNDFDEKKLIVNIENAENFKVKSNHE